MQLQIKLSHGEKPHRSSSLKAGATLRVGRETNAGATGSNGFMLRDV